MSQKRKERIEALSERLKQLQAQQSKAELRVRTMEARKARKEDTRRKVLAGSLVLSCLEDGRLSKTTFHTWLDEALDRPDDRALFGLGIEKKKPRRARIADSEPDLSPAALNVEEQVHKSMEQR